MTYIAGVNRAVDTGNTYLNELQTSLSGQTLKNRELLKQKTISDEPPLFARIGHARWIVDCPNCNNVEFAFEDGFFFCSQCQNGNGKIRRVILPKERPEIESILGKRLIVNRHWRPVETIETLLAENIEHGIEEI